MLKKIDLKGGKLKFNDFQINQNLSFKEQKWEYKEDLLQIYFDNGHLIDVGWCPEFEETGNFYIVVIKNYEWHKPIFERKCKNLNLLAKYLQQAINVSAFEEK
jgi:hypothetical protein